MTRQTQKLVDLHAEMRESFDDIQSAQQYERQQCLNDRRFYSIAGAQWEGKYSIQFENKPKFEINKIHRSVIRIFNEYRNNHITVDFISKEGIENDGLADTCENLYRADEENSSAQEAYDNAFEEAVGGGFGAWRLRAEYQDEYDIDNDKQHILIEPIYDADTSVFFDINAKKYDKSDAKLCFVLSSYTRKSMLEEWGEDVSTWPKEIISTTYFDWATPDVVYVAEVYKVEEVNVKVYTYKTLDNKEEKYTEEDFENDEELRSKLEAIGTVLEKERKMKKRKIRKYIMCGNKILEDCGYIAGKYIPIIPMYGKRWFVDNVERCMGHVRLSKDVQRLKNMQTSKLAEISTLSSVEKPILTPEQIAGHQLMWTDDNIENYPYLLINPVTNINGDEVIAPPTAYTKVPNIPPAMAALLQLTETDMREILGNQEGGEKIESNLSGKAVELIQTRLDMQTFIYMSNMAKSIKRCGEIWLSMAQELFIEEGRKMKGIVKDGAITSIELLKPKIDPDTSKIVYENDLSNASYDVRTIVGPSSSSKRDATVRSLTSMLPLAKDPETLQVITGMVMMNMEGEGIQEAREYFRNKLLRMGAVKPTEEESKVLAEELENKKEDPQSEAYRGLAEESNAKAAKARADTVLTVAKAEQTQADTEKIKAETIETLSNIDREDQLKVKDKLEII